MSALKKEVSWPIAAVVIGAFVVVGWFVMPRMTPHGPEHYHRVKCMNNLRQIVLGIKQYALDHDEKFPDSFGPLLKEGHIVSTRVFVCPSTRTRIPDDFPEDLKNADLDDLERIDEITDYVMVRGLDADAPADFILLFDRTPNHKGEGRNVGFIDGHMKWHTEEEFQRMISAQRAEMERMRAP